MARLPRARQEPQLIRYAALVAACLLLGPVGAPAQQVGDAAHAEVEGALRLTRMHGDVSWLAGVTGLIGVGGPLRFGGAGWIQLGQSSVPGGAAPFDYEMRIAYGGLAAELDIIRRPGGALVLRTLAGAGNAKIRSLPVVETLIAADNFGVVEPELSGAWRLYRGVVASVGLGYRLTFGVDDLPNVLPSDLRGPSLRIGISIGDF